ncbi:hypothetical protein B484DRAFT_440898, partial [Ochromonadaceae sp. CCMP2298]
RCPPDRGCPCLLADKVFVIPETVRVTQDTSGVSCNSVELCAQCLDFLAKKRVHNLMVGSGLDFSNITRLGHGEMSQLEACVLSSTLLYGTTIKLKAGGGLNSASRHTALTGHTIAFANSSEVHWDPAALPTDPTGDFPFRVDIPRDQFEILFVGTQAKWRAVKDHVLTSLPKIFSLRPDFILAYLRLRVEVRRAESFVVHGEERDCAETGDILKFFQSSQK